MAGNGQDLWSSLEANHQGFEPVQEKSHATEDSVVKDENVPPFESCSSKTTMVQKHLVMQVCWLFFLSLSLSLSLHLVLVISVTNRSFHRRPMDPQVETLNQIKEQADQLTRLAEDAVGKLATSVKVSVFQPFIHQDSPRTLIRALSRQSKQM